MIRRFCRLHAAVMLILCIASAHLLFAALFTDLTAPGIPVTTNLWNEITLAWYERSLTLPEPLTGTLWQAADPVNILLWPNPKALPYIQLWLEANCTNFLAADYAPTEDDGAGRNFTLHTWRQYAFGHTNGYRRARVFDPCTNAWTDAFDPMFSATPPYDGGYGIITNHDILGPWIIDDLQRGIDALSYLLIKGADSSVSTSYTRFGASASPSNTYEHARYTWDTSTTSTGTPTGAWSARARRYYNARYDSWRQEVIGIGPARKSAPPIATQITVDYEHWSKARLPSQGYPPVFPDEYATGVIVDIASWLPDSSLATSGWMRLATDLSTTPSATPYLYGPPMLIPTNQPFDFPLEPWTSAAAVTSAYPNGIYQGFRLDDARWIIRPRYTHRRP